MEKIKNFLENLEQKDWEVIGAATLVAVIGVAIAPVTASVVGGVVAGLALRGKVSL